MSPLPLSLAFVWVDLCTLDLGSSFRPCLSTLVYYVITFFELASVSFNSLCTFLVLRAKAHIELMYH